MKTNNTSKPTTASKKPVSTKKSATTLPSSVLKPKASPTRAARSAEPEIVARKPKSTTPAIGAIKAVAKPTKTAKPLLAPPSKTATLTASEAKRRPVAEPKASNPAPKAPTLPPTVTTIEAFIDVGFGNRLTLRGEGANGLSWERGLTMHCLGSAEWVLSLEGVVAPVSFKFLLNDAQWSVGENYTLAPGKTGAFTPEF